MRTTAATVATSELADFRHEVASSMSSTNKVADGRLSTEHKRESAIAILSSCEQQCGADNYRHYHRRQWVGRGSGRCFSRHFVFRTKPWADALWQSTGLILPLLLLFTVTPIPLSRSCSAEEHSSAGFAHETKWLDNPCSKRMPVRFRRRWSLSLSRARSWTEVAISLSRSRSAE